MNKLMVFLTVIAAVLLCLCLLSGYTDPRAFWPLAFFSLAFVPILLINLVFFIWWILRWKITVVIPAFAMIICGSIIKDTFSLHQKSVHEPKVSDDLLRVMTYNVHQFDLAYREASKANEIMKLIGTVQPDVICFQEFYSNKNQYSSIDSLQKILHTDQYYFKGFDYDKQTGIALFSKYPIVSRGKVLFTTDQENGNQCLYADIKKGDTIFRVYTVHLESIRLHEDQIEYMHSLLKGREKQLRPGKKIGGQLKHAFIKRSRQVDMVKASADTCPYPYIICGDFNDPPPSYAFQKMKEGLVNTFRVAGTGFYPVTFSKGLLRYQIDHILASPEFSVTSRVIIPQRLSDHYPVYADFRM